VGEGYTSGIPLEHRRSRPQTSERINLLLLKKQQRMKAHRQ
jgi:hypothetical protein